MFLKRWLALLLILAAPVLWADESCSLSECRYHVPLDRSGTYIAVVTLPSGQAEGLWSLIINPGQFSPQYLNGFWAGSVLKEQSQLPSWVAFSLSQTTPINITPYDWIGDGSPLTLQIDKDIGGGQRQLVYGPTLMNQGQTYTTQPLDPGFYITGLFSQPESVRTYRGLALEGHGLFGGVVGGYLDSFSGVGYGAFIISSPEIVEFLLVFGDTFGSLGASQPYLEIYYQHEDGTREIFWQAPDKPEVSPGDIPPVLAQERRHRASLGRLTGSIVEIFRLNDLENAFFATLTDENSYFGVDDALAGIDGGELLLVKVKLGQHTDIDGDNAPDSTPISNQGTSYALATAAQLSQGVINVSLTSDLAWLYTKNLVGNSPDEAFPLRLSDIAKVVFKADVNGDGEINGDDLIAFDASNSSHVEALTFKYQALLKIEEEGTTLLASYQTGNEDIKAKIYDSLFMGILTQYPALDSRITKKQLTLTLFGEGQILNHNGQIELQSQPDNGNHTLKKWLEKDQPLRFKAVAAEGYEFLYWTGCDLVSVDNLECALLFDSDRVVGATFGIKEPEVVSNIVDLSRASVTVQGEVYSITIDPLDTELWQKTAEVQVGYYIVSASNGGFLRKVTSVQRLSNYQYIFATEDASLTDVIKQGTITLNKQLDQDDIETFEILPEQNDATTRRNVQRKNQEVLTQLRNLPKTSTAMLETATKGVYIKKTDDPTEFRFVFGHEHNDDEDRMPRASVSVPASFSGSVVLYDEDGDYAKDASRGTVHDQIRAFGEIGVKLNIDFGVDFKLFGIRSLKFIQEAELQEKLGVEIGGAFPSVKKEITLATFKMPNGYIIPVGPVPVMVYPEIDVIFGFEGKVEVKTNFDMEFKQNVKAGFTYDERLTNKVETVAELKPTYDLNFPKTTAKGEVKAFLKLKPLVGIYGVEAFEVALEGYAKAEVAVEQDLVELLKDFEDCHALVKGAAALGLAAEGKFFGIVEGKEILGLDLSKLTVKFKLFGPVEWPFFTRLYGVGGDDCSTLPAKLHVKGSPIFESFNPDEASPDETILTEEYIITDRGDFPLDWEVDFEVDDVLTVSKVGGTGLKKDEADTVVVSINTSNITADAISRLLSDKTFGLMDGFISNLRGTSSVYRNVLQYKNTTKEQNITPFVGTLTDAQKGNTDISVKVKKLPPAFPTPQLGVPTVISATSAQLNWTYNSVEALNILPFLTGFNIAQSQDGINWEPRESVHGKLLRTYNVTGLEPERTYFFAITAYGEENQSNRSNEVSVTMPVLAIPPTAQITSPSNGSQFTVSEQISFDGNGTDEDGSIVSYQWVFGDERESQTSQNPTAQWNFAYDKAGTYTVYLLVTDDQGAVGQDFIQITITEPQVETGETEVDNPPPTPLLPNPPTNFKAVAGNGEITLSWDAVENATYNVYWKVVESGVQQVISGIMQPLYSHSGLVNGSAYSYQVTAVVNGIESPFSTEISATPLGFEIPDRSQIILGPGSNQVTLTFDLPTKISKAADIAFIVDQSGSYDDDIDNFQEKAEEIVDAFDQFGDSVYYALTGFDDYSENEPYQLHQELTPDKESFKNAVNELSIRCSSSCDEPQLDTVYRTVNDLIWRPGSLRIIFLSTDEDFDENKGYEYPETVSTLQDNNITLYGLAAASEAVNDLTQLAEATGGNSYRLSADSQEVVENITNALVELETSGQLVLEADNPLYVESITPKVIDIANMSAGDKIRFTVTFNRVPVSGSQTVEFSLFLKTDRQAFLERQPVILEY
jgi:PKD repeat protein